MRMRSSYWSWKKGCDTKTKEWEEVKKNRTDELIALAKIIKVLILVLAFHKIICILTLCLNWTWKVKVINVWFSFETATADGFKRGGSGKWSPFLQKLGKRKMCWNSLWVRKPGTRACWKPFRRMTETWPSLPSATPRALIQSVPFHLNFDYETAYALKITLKSRNSWKFTRVTPDVTEYLNFT